MKKLFYLMLTLFISSSVMAQSTSICDKISSWQNARGVSVTNTPAKYIVKFNRFSLGEQSQILLYGYENGNIGPKAQCQKLDNLLKSSYPVMLSVRYMYQLPNSNLTIQQPVLLIRHH